ncbi:hypothetical protein JHK86_006141 [Glycine max]|nr:hypothetical protein JHK86_006141 [Glycine max]
MRRIPTSVSSSAIQILFLLLASISIPFTLSQPSFPWKDGNGDLVDQVCKKTPFYDLCSSILHSNPLSPKPDLKGVALLVVNNILANATDTLRYIEGLIKQAPDHEFQGRFGFASYCISDVLKEVSSYDKKFSGATQAPLGDRNDIVQKLVNMASAMVKLLLKG